VEIVGNPWADIVIHTLFVIAYAVFVVWRKQSPDLKSARSLR
jgi:hypothetical protein